MDIPTQDELIERIESFCGRHDMAETRFGREAVNNPAFLSQLRKRKSPTLETLNKVSDFMERTDAEAATRAKLNAPLEPSIFEEASDELPFSQAPVNPTGAASPISSSTIAPPITPAASDSSQASSEARIGNESLSPSCSADEEEPAQ
jgi:hypothetical protein